MAIIDLGISQEQVMAALKPAPANRYRLTFEGFLRNPEGQDERERYYFPTRAGGKMVKARFRVMDSNPAAHGKTIIYSATVGSFSFAILCKVLPVMTRMGLDTEKAIGRTIEADVTIREYDTNNGEKGKANEIVKMFAV